MTTLAVSLPVLTLAKFNYFDMLAVLWLIMGLFWGRFRGISLEILPLLQWIVIVFAGALFYRSISPMINHSTYYTVLWSNIPAYVLIAVGVLFIFTWIKELWQARLQGKKLFGRAESNLGMLAGIAHFACVLLAVMALMNSHVATAADLAKTEKLHKDHPSYIYFPTYGEFQQDVIFKSLTGQWVQSHLKPILIVPPNSGPSQKVEIASQKSSPIIGDIRSQPAKQ